MLGNNLTYKMRSEYNDNQLSQSGLKIEEIQDFKYPVPHLKKKEN